ncbi:hypothetical protein BT69DRAFT_1296736 [Atractiella rhizophila]|nr:hypothetical protein BT69DRAFT_1296736 [Atractiella rhizophila]
MISRSLLTNVSGSGQLDSEEEEEEETDDGEIKIDSEEEEARDRREQRALLLQAKDDLRGSVYDDLMSWAEDKNAWTEGKKWQGKLRTQGYSDGATLKAWTSMWHRNKYNDVRQHGSSHQFGLTHGARCMRLWASHFEETEDIKMYGLQNDPEICAILHIWLRTKKRSVVMDPTKLAGFHVNTMVPLVLLRSVSPNREVKMAPSSTDALMFTLTKIIALELSALLFFNVIDSWVTQFKRRTSH